METAIASNTLRQQNLDLESAYTFINGVISRTNTLRNEDQLREIYHKAKTEVDAKYQSTLLVN